MGAHLDDRHLMSVAAFTGQAIQDALDAQAAAGGGTVELDPGIYLVDQPIVIPTQAATTTLNLRGAGSIATVLRATTDFGAGHHLLEPGDPAKPCYSTISDINLQGPFRNRTVGVAQCAMHGIRLGSRMKVRDAYIGFFNAGVVAAADHCELRDVGLGTNYYGLYFAGQTSQGDTLVDNCDLTGCAFASVAVAGDAVMNSVTFLRGHLGFAPYGVYLETHAFPDRPASGSVQFIGTSWESFGNGAVYDESNLSRLSNWHLVGCGSFTHYDDQKITTRPRTAAIRARWLDGWRLDETGFASTAFGDNGLIDTTSITGLVWTSPAGSLAASAGKPLLRATATAQGVRLDDPQFSALGLRPGSAVTKGRLVRATTAYRCVQNDGLGRLLGVALNTVANAAPDLVLIADSGQRQKFEAASPMSPGAVFTPDTADPSKVKEVGGADRIIGSLYAGSVPGPGPFDGDFRF